jgi:hypothetical protein
VKDLTAGLPTRINLHCRVESDQEFRTILFYGSPGFEMEKRKLARFSVVHSCAISKLWHKF